MEGTQYLDKGKGDEYRDNHEAIFGKKKLNIKEDNDTEKEDSKEENTGD